MGAEMGASATRLSATFKLSAAVDAVAAIVNAIISAVLNIYGPPKRKYV